jgi:hypothetical protein
MRRLYGHCVGLPSSTFGQFDPALATCLWLQLFSLKPEVQIKVQTEKSQKVISTLCKFGLHAFDKGSALIP